VPDTLKKLTSWVFAPATDPVPTYQAAGAAVLRVSLGLLWLHNVSWKVPPHFGNEKGGLFHWAALAVDHPVFAPYSWVVEHAVLPNIEMFGWSVLAAESALAVLLLTGAWVRLIALVGIAQSIAIGLSVAYAPGEWPWAYVLMAAGHIVILTSSAGRVFGVDGVRAGLVPAARLGRVWAGIAGAVGVVAVVGASGAPLAAQGFYLRIQQAEVSLGRYNVVGALILLLLAALLAVGGRWTVRVAAGLAFLAALSLTAQVGFADPWLGGNATSAAFFAALAVVALVRPAPESSQVGP